ncbi:MAG: NADH-quinone oxidoreductase subunit NuoG [Verrucomicrobia bacterium]|nr:NADH-quinone oxidoreductase subunit NuoG [Verrucomicrobiota bacterium]
MATIYIDQRPYAADPRTNLLQASLALGFDLPYFCWHPALGSVGACRQCAVKQFRDEKDKHGKIVMACMVPALEGTRLSIDDPEAREFRAAVVEWLMTNHPHDCPVCDEGGECHLQDVTVMTGHAYRRYRFEKRTFRYQDLGPFISHEMNRCIQCYRCVRFYRDYAGGRDLDAFAAHNHVYFGRHEDGVLESEFSGNLVEVCPTGVFTDKTLKRHFTRKWDLQSAPSICTHCALGCNTIAGERGGVLRRILNRYHHDVNGYFLCDRGRFGYEFVHHLRRIRRASARLAPGEERREIARTALRGRLAALLTNPERVIGIGSPRASLEANFALRTLVGAERFFQGASDRECGLLAEALRIMRAGPGRIPSLRDVAESDAVLVLGEDVTNTAPRLALALRQAVRQQPLLQADRMNIPRWHDRAVRDLLQDRRGPLFLGAVAPTRIDDIATRFLRASPENLARLGCALARRIDGHAPEESGVLPTDAAAFIEEAAAALLAAKRPLVVAGVSLGSAALLAAAANVARALSAAGRPAALSLVFPEANSLGTALLGGGRLSEAFAAAAAGRVETAIILENDIYRRAAPRDVDAFLRSVPHVVVLDTLAHRTADAAAVVLPAGTFAETNGTFVNHEGRAQRFFQVLPPDEWVRESWRWLGELATGSQTAPAWPNLDAVIAALIAEFPELAGVRRAAPGADFRVGGQKIARASRRFSGRTAQHANLDVSEPKPPDDPDSPLSYSMEGYPGQPPAALVNLFWSPGWNSVQSVNKFQNEIASPLAGGDPGVRLLEPASADAAVGDYFPSPIGAWEDGSGGALLAVPRHHIFGSEELSALAPGVAERMPAPCAEMNPDDARALPVQEGGLVRVTIDGRDLVLPVRLEAGLPRGLLSIPVGLPDLPGLDLPAAAAVKGVP